MMKILVAVVLAGFSTLAAAQNWVALLKNTAAERFNEDDLQMFLAAGRKALTQAKDNETVRWENPDTRARGELTVLRSFDWESHACKELRLYNEAGGRRDTSTLKLCSVDGRWRLLAPSQYKKAS